MVEYNPDYFWEQGIDVGSCL